MKFPIEKHHCRLYRAILTHYFWRAAVYGHIFLDIKENEGKMTSDTIKVIAQKYSVQRGIIRTENNNDNAISSRATTEIAESCNKLAETWPNSLPERASSCKTQAEKWKHKQTHGLQLSAITKYMWFLRPHGWTVYDSNASRALIDSNLSGIERYEKFYDILERYEFTQWASVAQEYIDKTCFSFLFGGITIDNWLLIIDSDRRNHTRDAVILNSFFAHLPPSLCAELDQFAHGLIQRTRDLKLTRFMRERERALFAS